MFWKRFSIVSVVFALALLSLNCQDTADPLSPVEPQMDKPPKPPKPPRATEPVIQEFWVYDNPDIPGEQCIHFLVSGTFDGMGINVAYDHFFNGYQDLHDHYEFYFIGGPPRQDTEFREIAGLGMVGHEDHCFNGERDSKTPDNFKYFMDYPSTSIKIDGVTGYDPIALVPAVIIGDTGVRFFHPKGVVLGGNTFAPEDIPTVTSIWDHDLETPGYETYANPQFYAVWKGKTAPGNIYVEDLSISNVSCTLKYGKGKNKNTVLGTTISLDAAFEYGVWNPPETIAFWGEGHVRVVQEGAQVSLLSERRRTPPLNGSRSYSWTLPTDLSGQDVEVEFALDYLQATDSQDAYDRVYDPGLNGVFTSAGFDGSAWHPEDNVSSKLYDEKFPVAHSRPDPTQYPKKDVVLVSCG